MKYILITPEMGENKGYTINHIADFLENHLDRFGDKNSDILKAIQYALDPSKGGFIELCIENTDIIGAVVVNKTGMDGYIPSNILVYIAIHRDYRGKGFGKKLMIEAMSKTTGGIALHVESDNPAKFLYEKLGFVNKYLEMRYQPEEI
ncbi:MAG TPA: GNAT family N-acetyltransferase [Prolixibacteraceae bacterium]|nr:GNAT family N-acetyltransferase [Prolixibacteraceae bacterium]